MIMGRVIVEKRIQVGGEVTNMAECYIEFPKCHNKKVVGLYYGNLAKIRSKHEDI